MAEQTWTIRDIDGINPRPVTLAQFRAEIEARKAMARPIMNAVQRGDVAGFKAAQSAMRAAFPK